MGGGQKSETTVEQPKWYQEAAKRNLRIANQAAQIGYVPYQGADVAAFDPQQVQGMQMANNMAAAFGSAGNRKPASVKAGLPEAETFGGGVNGGPAIRGYSSYGGFVDEQDRMKANMPGLFSYLSKFSIDPKTGAPAEFYDKDKLLAEASLDPEQSSDFQNRDEYYKMLRALRGESGGGNRGGDGGAGGGTV